MSTTFRILIIILFVVFLISIAFFVRGIRDVRHGGFIRPHNPLGIIFSGTRQVSGEIVIKNVDSIDIWMTFAYINFTFRLDENTLRDTLGIKNPRYPKLTLRAYIKQENLDKILFLNQVKEAVRTHISNIPKK